MELIKRLEKKGIVFEQGLSAEEIDKIERIYDIEFPYELKNMYMKSLPISEGFYKWRDFSESNVDFITSIINIVKEEIETDTEDIEWSDNWGEEPTDLKKRIEIINEQLKIAPKLIPIYGHRYIASSRMKETPVFSVHGTDIIHYGENLEQYLEIEFGMKSYDEMQYDKIIKVPFWSDIFNKQVYDDDYFDGCYRLGIMFENGNDVEQDYLKASKLYEQACDGGDADGCFSLGTMYIKGNGFKQDYQKALKLYKKACDGGHTDACEMFKILNEEVINK